VGNDETGPQKEAGRTHVEPADPEKVNSRAEGRPPEERSSDNPRLQAEAILEDSEDRLAQGSAKSHDGHPD
jgi:hypothetical protein